MAPACAQLKLQSIPEKQLAVFVNEVRKTNSSLRQANLYFVKESYPYGRLDDLTTMFEHYLNYSPSFPKKVYQPEIINGRKMERYVDSIEFTKQECDALTSYLKSPPTYNWTKKIINENITTGQQVRIAFDSDSTGYGAWGEFGDGIVEMSYPFFLRNNTICLFYWGMHCGMTCGYGTLSIYVKREGKWKEFTSLYSFDG